MSFKLLLTTITGIASLSLLSAIAQPPPHRPPPFGDNFDSPDFRRPPPPHRPESHFNQNNTGVASVSPTNNQVEVTEDSDYRYITSNGVPDHQFGPFTRNQVAAQQHKYRVTKNPQKNSAVTPLAMGVSIIFLNGVPADTLSAECWNVAKHQCHNTMEKWRENVMAEGKFNLDTHHAHVQPSGTYHYHGDPNAIYSKTYTYQASDIIGYAADGFPVYGPYIKSEKGSMRRAKSSYQLRKGERPKNAPNGLFNGDYNDDFEYVTTSGDLDECNGGELMGRPYGYYVTKQYPYLISCFKGTPNSSFGHRGKGWNQRNRGFK